MRVLRVRQLRDELRLLGVNTAGCSDRESLLELLEAQGATALEAQLAAADGLVQLPIYLMRIPDQLGISDDVQLITVDLSLRGMTYRFVMDTGASSSLIVEQMAAALNAADLGIPAWAQGATGMQQGMRLIRVEEATLGPMACGPLDLVATVQPLPIPPGTAGILGLDFIRRFDWDLDLAAGRCQVALPAARPLATLPPFNLQGLREMPVSFHRTVGPEMLTVALQLSAGQRSTSCIAVFDLGATITLCNTAVARALGLGPGELRDTGMTLSGLGGSAVRVQEALLTLAIGSGQGGPVTMDVLVAVGDLPFFAQLGMDNCGPVVVLGLDALGKSSRLALSATAGRAWLPTV